MLILLKRDYYKHLEFLINNEGVKVNPDKHALIMDLPTPQMNQGALIIRPSLSCTYSGAPDAVHLLMSKTGNGGAHRSEFGAAILDL